jgi:hypothetical protein
MRSHLIILVLLLAISSENGFSQKTILKDNGHYKFFPGSQEPDSGWRKLQFDDSSWKSDSGRIGYGESDVKTVIQKTTSLYLRITFKMENVDWVQAMCLNNDYNDGFIAYLNGIEIARTNLGMPGEFIPFDRVTDRSHKAYDYRKYYNPLNGYYLDNEVIKKSLRNGTNILAIQVHNDSINGSDMSFNCSLVDLTGHIYFFTDDYFKQVNLDSTLFPIVNINTDAYGIPNNDSQYIAKMSIINNSNGKYNKLTNIPADYNGRISIKLHGSSSSLFPKKSFGIETQDSAGKNNNVPILGMPKENDWILVSQFTDRSLIRNELAYYMGRKMGHYEPRTRYCDLVLNGEYLGLYSLAEKIKRDSNRVNIAKHKASDISGDDVTGGYIVKYDRPDYNTLQFVYPKDNDIQPEQNDYIDQYFINFYASLDKPSFLDPDSGYASYIDTQSLIDYIIAEEAMKNADAYFNSTFMYKDRINRDGRIKFGPLWDHDIAFGNYGGCYDPSGWQFRESGNIAMHITKILRDTSLVHQLQKRWHIYRGSFLNADSMVRTIDSMANYITADRIRNFEVWPILDGPLFAGCYYPEGHTFTDEIDSLKEWINRRFTWIDENIGNIYYPITGVSTVTELSSDFKVFPNPFTDAISIQMKLKKTGNYSFQIFDVYGREIYLSPHHEYSPGDYEYEFDRNTMSDLPKGIYIVTLVEDGNNVYQYKIVKE